MIWHRTGWRFYTTVVGGRRWFITQPEGQQDWQVRVGGGENGEGAEDVVVRPTFREAKEFVASVLDEVDFQ